tara:strand:- start:1368 stop:2942 length:1575 start_codon:yes stop_codon:yes gene_type:complete
MTSTFGRRLLESSTIIRVRWYALAFILGSLLSTSLPPIYALPILPLVFCGLFIMIARSNTLWRAMLTGWFFGFGYFLVTFHWIGAALLINSDRFGWLVVPSVLLLSLCLAVFVAITSALVWLCPTNSLGKVICLAFFWTGSEWIRGKILSGFPMSPVGTVWTISEGMIQISAVFGVFGLTFLTVFASTLPATAYFFRIRPKRKSIMFGIIAAVTVLVANWVGGEIRILSYPVNDFDRKEELRLVQANIAQKDKWTDLERKEIIQKHIRLSIQGDSRKKIIVWPETAVPIYFSDEQDLVKLISPAISNSKALITGAPRVEKTEENTKIWNSLFLIKGDGSIGAIYDKHHLVPFGEYMPLRSILGISQLVSSAKDFSAGSGPMTIGNAVGLPPFSPLICYEGIFPGDVVEKGKRPQWLLNITNDAWFGSTSGPYQHFQTARLRSVEEGLPLIRVANTGISAIIDPLGRIEQSLGLGKEGVIDGFLPPGTESAPPYAILGDWILLISSVPLILLIYLGKRRYKSKVF